MRFAKALSYSAAMEMRHARFDDVAALVAFDGAVNRQEWQRILNDPWVTVTIAEEDGVMCGWVTYTVDELQQLVLRSDLWGTEAVGELYGECLGHWRTAATERARAWVAEDDPAVAYLEEQGWRSTGRTRRIPHRPEHSYIELTVQPISP